MKPQVKRTEVPLGSAINPMLQGAYFHDCHAITIPDAGSMALDYFLRALVNTPTWINFLMALRNKIVQVVGLKDLGGLGQLDASKPASSYALGDRVGIFTLIASSPDEALLGDRDRHLNVVLSVFRSPCGKDGLASISVTTVVHVNNLLGRIYMLPVAPLHKIIAPTVLQFLAREGH